MPATNGGVGLFDGLAPEEQAECAAVLQRRLFRAGEDLLREGQPSGDIFVLESGVAEASRTNSLGLRQLLSRFEAGATCGEVSLLTGKPVSATVTAVTEVTALVLTATDFVDIATKFPAIYRNVGAILAERLVHADRRTAAVAPQGRLVWMVDHGAPPLLSYALACSIAWHSQRETVLLVADTALYAETLGSELLDPSARRDIGSARVRAFVEHRGPLTATGGAVADTLRLRGANVLVLVTPGDISTIDSDLVVHLARPDMTLSSATTAGRPVVRAWSDQAPAHGSELFVPTPNGSDRASLSGGLLALNTGTGRALGRVARELCSLRVGLALGEGGAKGFAHLGVLRSLQRLGVPCDSIAGTSIGAAVAGLYAAGFPVDIAQAHLARVGSATFHPVLPMASLMSVAGVARIMRAVWGDNTRIEDLPTPLAIVAADIVTGSEVVLNRGLLWAALLPASPFPASIRPNEWGNACLSTAAWSTRYPAAWYGASVRIS